LPQRGGILPLFCIGLWGTSSTEERTREMGMRKGRTGRGHAFITVLALAIGMAASCATRQPPSGGVPEIEAWLLPNQNIRVEGRDVDTNHLVGQLVSCGAGRSTVVKLRFQTSQSTTTFSRLASMLETAGFQKVIFVGPRQVTSSVTR
jgi:hypothetical protein